MMNKRCCSSGVEHVIGNDGKSNKNTVKYIVSENDSFPSVPLLSPSVPTDSGKTRGCVYRHFNSDGCLLYIGSSKDILSRTAQHNERADWFHEISTITIEHFSSVDDARIAEKTAIEREHPKYNQIYAKYKAPRLLTDAQRAKRRRTMRITAAVRRAINPC